MDNRNLEKDLERVASYSVPPPPFRERALGIAATAERIMIRVGKVGLVLVVVATAALAFANEEEAEDLNRQVDVRWKAAYSPSPARSWVARELVFKGGTSLLPGPAVPTGKFVCGGTGEVPKKCPPAVAAQTTELCALPWTDESWPKTVRPVGVAPAKFGVPFLCPESILHPEK